MKRNKTTSTGRRTKRTLLVIAPVALLILLAALTNITAKQAGNYLLPAIALSIGIYVATKENNTKASNPRSA